MESTVTTWQGPYSCPDCLIDRAKLANPCSACKRVARTVAAPPVHLTVNLSTTAPWEVGEGVRELFAALRREGVTTPPLDPAWIAAETDRAVAWAQRLAARAKSGIPVAEPSPKE